MFRRAQLIITFAILIWGNSLNASSHSAKEGAKVFVLQGKEQPAKVLPVKLLDGADGEIMRMPDLGGQLSSRGTKLSPRESHRVQNQPRDRVMAKRAKGDEIREKPMRFSKANIKGTLRLPRVKFARISVPIDIREELPSLDFTEKSLKDSDF